MATSDSDAIHRRGAGEAGVCVGHFPIPRRTSGWRVTSWRRGLTRRSPRGHPPNVAARHVASLTRSAPRIVRVCACVRVIERYTSPHSRLLCSPWRPVAQHGDSPAAAVCPHCSSVVGEAEDEAREPPAGPQHTQSLQSPDRSDPKQRREYALYQRHLLRDRGPDLEPPSASRAGPNSPPPKARAASAAPWCWKGVVGALQPAVRCSLATGRRGQ